jgi:hypothetical protein
LCQESVPDASLGSVQGGQIRVVLVMDSLGHPVSL